MRLVFLSKDIKKIGISTDKIIINDIKLAELGNLIRHFIISYLFEVSLLLR